MSHKSYLTPRRCRRWINKLHLCLKGTSWIATEIYPPFCFREHYVMWFTEGAPGCTVTPFYFNFCNHGNFKKSEAVSEGELHSVGRNNIWCANVEHTFDQTRLSKRGKPIQRYMGNRGLLSDLSLSSSLQCNQLMMWTNVCLHDFSYLWSIFEFKLFERKTQSPPFMVLLRIIHMGFSMLLQTQGKHYQPYSSIQQVFQSIRLQWTLNNNVQTVT